MLVTEKTKISKIIAHNEDAIDTIASINKNFIKLKNPVLRKLLAGRITVEDASRVGGVSVNVFLKKLNEIGFEVNWAENEDEFQDTDINNNNIEAMNEEKTITLDVRPILAGGTDPFKAIMSSLKDVKEDETLLVINSFEPIPLLNKLKAQGYKYTITRPEEGVVYSYITKSNEIEPEKNTTSGEKMSFTEALEKYTGLMKDIDVRQLEMPMPMVTILEEVEQLETGYALYVNHKKLPQYLIPELETRGFLFAANQIDNDNTKLIIYKK